jgi:nucleotide-binding universal stress UspA family protein
MSEKMKLLIAYDGSECADSALVDLSLAGLPKTVEAIVLSVADVWVWSSDDSEVAMPVHSRALKGPMSEEGGGGMKAIEEARALATKASRRVQDIFPDWSVRAEDCADSPAWGTIKKADQWKPDLVVVGSQGRSALGRFILGSVSQKVLTHAHCSVRVARGRADRDDSPIRIVIGVDGSSYAEAAVDAVARRAWPAGTLARIVAVPDLMMMAAIRWLEEIKEAEQASANKIVEASAEKLRRAGLSVSTLIKEGDPKYILVDEAEQWGADSIFLGARGLRAIERFLIGSVSTAVASRAGCSVEVIRAEKSI